MKNFIAIYLGSTTNSALANWNNLDEVTRKKQELAGMNGWASWATTHHKVIVDQGGPLGKTKRINKEGVADIKNQMAAYTIVKAETHEAAAQLFLNHPHFMIFPGDSIEVMECLPIPKM